MCLYVVVAIVAPTVHAPGARRLWGSRVLPSPRGRPLLPWASRSCAQLMQEPGKETSDPKGPKDHNVGHLGFLY